MVASATAALLVRLQLQPQPHRRNNVTAALLQQQPHRRNTLTSFIIMIIIKAG
jgi:hypothetical protein